jgi:hypothetical protein
VEVERAALQALQRGYTELQGLLLHQGPGARRDQLMEQLKRVGWRGFLELRIRQLLSPWCQSTRMRAVPF